MIDAETDSLLSPVVPLYYQICSIPALVPQLLMIIHQQFESLTSSYFQMLYTLFFRIWYVPFGKDRDQLIKYVCLSEQGVKLDVFCNKAGAPFRTDRNFCRSRLWR